MERDWHDSEFHERMTWVRVNVLKLTKLKAAADFYGFGPGTYRTWELAKANEGRVPDLNRIKALAKKAGVSWQWLALGEGQPFGPVSDQELYEMAERIAAGIGNVPEHERENAVRAIDGILSAFSKAS